MKQSNIPVIKITETEISIPTALINMSGVTVVNIVKDTVAETTEAPAQTTPIPTTHEPTTTEEPVQTPEYMATTTEEPATSTLEDVVDGFLK